MRTRSFAWLRRLGAALFLAAACAASAVPSAPSVITYQGFLTSTGGAPVSATLTMNFSLWSELAGGSEIWSETQSVPVNNGLFRVLLGQVNPLGDWFGTQLYLQVQVGADPAMTPRQLLTAVPVALSAKSAETAMTVATAPCSAGDFINCYTGPAGTMGVGVCKAGTRTCDTGTGTYGTCSGQVIPVPEVSDGIDNDCDGVVDNTALPNGAACAAGVNCASTYCVDGVCSNTACSGACESPNASYSGGVAGVCTTVPDGTDPRSLCGPYYCNGALASCPTTCAASADCKPTAYCSVAGICANKLANGSACTASAACSSGFCVDGYCSNSACNGLCQATNQPGSIGICVFIPNGQDPANECPGTSTCNGMGGCTP